MKKVQKLAIIASAILITLGLTAFAAYTGGSMASGDQSKGATEAFTKILKEYPKNVGYHDALSHWGFKLATGEKFEWTKDLSANKVDLAMVLMADQFTKAGLDIKKLDKNLWIFKPAEVEAGISLPNRLIIPYNINDKKKRTMGYAEAFKNVLSQNTKLIKLNKEEGHYMLSLGNGNEVHWTNKLGSSDADFEFVVSAKPLIKAGLNITKLKASGWKFEAAGTADGGMNKDQLVKEFKLK